MNFYVNYYKNEIATENDNPPIDLILCANKNNTKVKYAKAGLDENLFVSKYKISLPSVEEMEQFIRDELMAFNRQKGIQHSPLLQTFVPKSKSCKTGKETSTHLLFPSVPSPTSTKHSSLKQ